MSGLLLKNVSKIYPGGQQAIKDFTLEIKEREFLILAGSAGCGKSTLLRMIAGLEEISSGSLYIDGRDMTKAEPRQRNLAMVFKNSVLYPNMSVSDNLSFALRMGKMDQGEIDRRIGETAGLLKLEKLLDKMPEELNKEEAYRVLLGRALMRRPGILLLDSTIADLDEEVQIAMRKEFLNVYEKLDMTVIYATDNQETAMMLGTRMVVMDDGTVCQDDTPENLVAHPANRMVASVVGSPAMSFFPVGVFREEDRIGLRGKSGYMFLSEALGTLLTEGGYLGKEVLMGIRANAVHVRKDEKKGVEGVFSVKFQGMDSCGKHMAARFQVEEFEGLCLTEEALTCKPGEEIHLVLDGDKVFLFDRETEKPIMN